MIEATLVRKIFKETDVKVVVRDWLESTATVKTNPGKVYLFFACELDEDHTELQTSDETPEVFWSKICDLDLSQCTPTLKEYTEKRLP